MPRENPCRDENVKTIVSAGNYFFPIISVIMEEY